MSRFGRDLQLTLQAAYREAISRRHAYLTVEHLLFALLHNDPSADILVHSGAQLDQLRADLESFFDERGPLVDALRSIRRGRHKLQLCRKAAAKSLRTWLNRWRRFL